MSTPITDQPEYKEAAKKFIASIAIKQSNKMAIEEKIMIHHGVADLFDKESPEYKEAKETAYSLASAERKQLKLKELLEN